MTRAILKVGPLAATSVNNIATTQSPGAASQLVLNGTLGTATANNICTTQTITGATALTINGTLSQTLVWTAATGALIGITPQYIYITSAGNDSGITFAVVGLTTGNVRVTETSTGANTAVAPSASKYIAIISITASGSTAAGVTVGTWGAATLDTPRRVLITTGSAISFTITGTDWAGDSISETVTNAGASVASVLSYATVTSISTSASGTSITVGTNGIADSPWVHWDTWSPNGLAIQGNATGTVNYTLFFSQDSPNSATGATSAASVNWISSNSPIVGATGNVQGTMALPFIWAKVTLNSETAGAGNFASVTIDQLGNVMF